jgi:SAM-dependent methyltransferase
MKIEDLERVQKWISEVEILNRVVISGRRKSHHPNFERIDIRPVQIRDEIQLQVVFHDGKQDITKNLKVNEFRVDEILNQGYANLLIERRDQTLNIRITKQGNLQVHRAKAQDARVDLEHNRKKARLLPINDPIFTALGIANSKGDLIPRQSDKYRQVDDFLRIVESVRDKFGKEEISIVDLGCGNAYLTFAVHRYLRSKGNSVKVIGVDSKEDSRIRNSKIATDLSIQDEVTFVASRIEYFPIQKANLVIALHACDTATDDALAWAVKSNASAILVSPCCHHELNKDIEAKDDDASLIFRHGILKERFADLLTDSLRAEILKIYGYRTDIFEFVSIDHTPRNLMIRAVFTGNMGERDKYEKVCAKWQINPYLATLLD